MLPAFVIVNVTVPAATLACDSSTFHSESRTFTWEAASGCGRGAAPTSAPSNTTVATVRPPTPFALRSIGTFLVKVCDIESIHGQDPRSRLLYSRERRTGRARSIDRHADGDRGRHGSRVPGYWVTVIEATKLGYSDGGWILQ